MADQSLKGKSVKRCGGLGRGTERGRGRGRGDERTSSRRKRKREKGEKKCVDKVQIDKYVISINLHC